jgi:hypothetical protein
MKLIREKRKSRKNTEEQMLLEALAVIDALPGEPGEPVLSRSPDRPKFDAAVHSVGPPGPTAASPAAATSNLPTQPAASPLTSSDEHEPEAGRRLSGGGNRRRGSIRPSGHVDPTEADVGRRCTVDGCVPCPAAVPRCRAPTVCRSEVLSGRFNGWLAGWLAGWRAGLWHTGRFLRTC